MSFDTDGGSTIAPQTVQAGGHATRPAEDPTKANALFEDWFEDAECTTNFDFANTEINEDTTIYAAWVVADYVMTFPASLPIAPDYWETVSDSSGGDMTYSPYLTGDNGTIVNTILTDLTEEEPGVTRNVAVKQGDIIAILEAELYGDNALKLNDGTNDIYVTFDFNNYNIYFLDDANEVFAKDANPQMENLVVMPDPCNDISSDSTILDYLFGLADTAFLGQDGVPTIAYNCTYEATQGDDEASIKFTLVDDATKHLEFYFIDDEGSWALDRVDCNIPDLQYN